MDEALANLIPNQWNCPTLSRNVLQKESIYSSEYMLDSLIWITELGLSIQVQVL